MSKPNPAATAADVLDETEFEFRDSASPSRAVSPFRAPAAPAPQPVGLISPLMKVEQILGNVVRGANHLTANKFPNVARHLTADQVAHSEAVAARVLAAYSELQDLFCPPRQRQG